MRTEGAATHVPNDAWSRRGTRETSFRELYELFHLVQFRFDVFWQIRPVILLAVEQDRSYHYTLPEPATLLRCHRRYGLSQSHHPAPLSANSHFPPELVP